MTPSTYIMYGNVCQDVLINKPHLPDEGIQIRELQISNEGLLIKEPRIDGEGILIKELCISSEGIPIKVPRTIPKWIKWKNLATIHKKSPAPLGMLLQANGNRPNGHLRNELREGP
ncbi:hypothetical protein Fot_11209 [Forsythia ovata]|uniref:Uncharacterized protein n=1 Tax=Forsythia ovata TaxID=205694 RepID=A0ABD1WJ25_9LAMI